MTKESQGIQKRHLLTAITASAILPCVVESQIQAFQSKQTSADYTYQQSVTRDAKTVNIAPSESFSNCTCDLTPKGCDHACCCDSYCDAAAVAKWRLKPGFCLDELHDAKIVGVDNCVERAQQATIQDLQGGLQIYTKQARSLMCTQTKQEQSVTNYFIGETFQASTAEEFAEIREAEIQDTSGYTFIAPPVDDGILINAAAGYQPFEYLKGNSFTKGADVDNPLSVFRDDDKVSFSRPGIFGHCEHTTPALFMQNSPEDTCVVTKGPINADTCTSVSFEKILKTLKTGSQVVDLTVSATLPTMKFDLNTFDQVKTLTAAESERVRNDKFLQATFSNPNSSTCACDNFILEAHYKVYFEDSSSEANAFSINKFEVEVVYGQISLDCAKDYHFNLKTSVTYLESSDGRIYSGSPGYLLGSPVLIGQTDSVEVTESQGTSSLVESITLNKNGFPLRGATNDGKCYFVDKSVNDEQKIRSDTAAEFVKADFEAKYQARILGSTDELTYYEDPVLTFEDSLIYGCSIELDYEQFKDFCSNNLLKNMMLYQNLFLMDKVGISGNADPHYIKDWLNVEINESKDTFNDPSKLQFDETTCQLPSVRIIEIFYKRINTQEQPQYIIAKMQHYSPSRSQSDWKFSQPDRTKKQSFQASVVINSYIVEQDLNLFVPTFEDIIEPLDRNVLYPFFVYGGEEDQN